tara:strand:+ start:985 stop:1461 length:477 start_codon:yes stop_codon:yes gene_type:complete
MSKKYFYLEEFEENKTPDSRNWFKSVREEDVEKYEKMLAFLFPEQLKEFYCDIGYGCFRGADEPSRLSDPDNLILDPKMIADILLEKEDAISLPDISFLEGDMPFFEVGDGSNFLIMRPNSENPNAVYDMWGDFVEKDFETFIYKLYHEAPDYYMKNW